MKTVATIAGFIFLAIVAVFVWIGMQSGQTRVFANYGLFVTNQSTFQLANFTVAPLEGGRNVGAIEFLKTESRGAADPAMLELLCVGLMFDPPSDPALPPFEVDKLKMVAIEQGKTLFGPPTYTETTQTFEIVDRNCVAITEPETL